MFSTRNGQVAPGVKNFGMQAPSKGFPGVRVFKGPTLSSFHLNPFSTVSAHFDSFDVGYRSSQSDFATQGRGGPPARNQQQLPTNWQAPGNIYEPLNPPPPPPPSHAYQQNSMGHFGLRTASQSSASRSQEPPRHRDAQQQQPPFQNHNHNYYIHPGISTDMYIYEASDAFSEYSPSSSPSPFSPALSTDSTLTVQSPSPLPLGQSELLRNQGRSTTPFLRATTPVPPAGAAQSRARSPQSHPSNSYSSNSSNSGIPFPTTLPGVRQAQNALRGLFGSNGQAGTLGETTQTQSMGNSLPRVRTPSESSGIVDTLPYSETEFDDLARMNTALNAGYSYYFPESKAQIRPRLASTSGANGAHQRSPRDSLMFYNGAQRADNDPNLPYSQPATINVSMPMSDQPPSSSTEMLGEESQGSDVPSTLDRRNSALIPALERSISSSSQSSELSILRTPSPTPYPPQRSPSHLRSQSYSDSYPTVQSKPVTQAATAAYTSVLSASPEPQLSSVQVPAPASVHPPLASSVSHSQSSSASSSGSYSGVSNPNPSTIRERVGGAAEYSNADTVTDTSPNQAYPMPHVVPTEIPSRSFNNTTTTLAADPLNISQSVRARSPPRAMNGTYGDLRNVMPPATENSETGLGVTSERNVLSVRARKSTTTDSSPLRAFSQPTPDSQRVDVPPRSSLPASTPAPPQQVLTRVRKDSMSLGMKSSSSSRPMSRSTPTAPYHSISNIGAVVGEPNSKRLAVPSTVQTSSTSPVNPLPISTVPTNIPSSFPEPRRRHSDGDNPSLTGATRRSSVPFQSEFVPAVSNSSGSHVNREESAQPAYINNCRPEPTRTRSNDVPIPTRPDSTDPRLAVETLRLRCVRWNEELICPSPIWPSQRRKGWFNRRGDQLWTNGGAFRSPTGGGYPPDLDGYPEYGEGWMNEEGTRIDMAHRLIPKAPLRSALKTKGRAPGSLTGC